MPTAARVSLFCVLGLLSYGQTACNLVPRQELLQSQNRTKQLYEQNKALALERQSFANDNARLQQELGAIAGARDALQRQNDNLNAERGKLQSMYASLKSQNTPLSKDTTRQLEELRRKYPGFDFDPQTGVSKFSTDIAFDSGSDAVKPNALPMLRDFAKILNNGDAKDLNILVVGHTDDMRVAKPATKAKHPDNQYLSAHRAIGVVHELAKSGIKENRMGHAGYGPHQPLVPNTDTNSRAKNRRVEIFVLAPNASMAGWDTGAIRK